MEKDDRDVLIHHYFGVDYKIVWDVVKNLVPLLLKEINVLIDEIIIDET